MHNYNSSLFAIVAVLSLSASSSAVTVDRQTLLTSRRENRKQRRLNKKNTVIDTEDIEFFTQQARSLQSFNPTPRPPSPRPPPVPTPPAPRPTRRPTVSIAID